MKNCLVFLLKNLRHTQKFTHETMYRVCRINSLNNWDPIQFKIFKKTRSFNPRLTNCQRIGTFINYIKSTTHVPPLRERHFIYFVSCNVYQVRLDNSGNTSAKIELICRILRDTKKYVQALELLIRSRHSDVVMHVIDCRDEK